MKNGKTIVIGVIGSDCHAVGNKIIDHVLKLSFLHYMVMVN